MKKRISFLSALLVFLMIFGVLTACDSSESGGNQSNDGPNINIDGGTGDGGDTGADAADERILPDLPESDFNGHVFTVLSHREESDDWYSPDPREIVAEVAEAEEPINDAVYRRNAILKERYNIDFDMVTNTDAHSLLRRTVNAGDDVYDAAIMFNNNVPTVVNGGLLVNVENLPFIDLDKPWWDAAVNGMSIANKQFLLAGDLLILDNEATNALVFNKELMQDLGMGLPYDMVKEGKWTMDVMNEMIKGASMDMNGDGQMTPLDDRWGFVTFNDTLHALFVGGGGALAVKDENDLPFMDFTNPYNLRIIDLAMEIMYNKQDVLNIQSDITNAGTANANWFQAYHGAFEEDRALFTWVRMRVVEKFRGMDSDFGILPLPKFEEHQPNYLSVVNPYTGVLLGVPKTVDDLERTSIILEALSAESRYTLHPAYYDVVLQRKFARDEDSSDMLDIIFGNRVYDIGAVYAFGNAFLDFIALCNRSNRDIISYYDRRQGAMERDIERVIGIFEDMD